MQNPIEHFKEYLDHYIRSYNVEYNKLVNPTYPGGAYPKWPISPFLVRTDFECYIFQNGVLLFERNTNRHDLWYVTGGPAFSIDYEPSVLSAYIVGLRLEYGLIGQSLGISRLVSEEMLADEIWTGNFGVPVESSQCDLSLGHTVLINRYEFSLLEGLSRLTFGAFGPLIKLQLPDQYGDFGVPRIVRNMGFFPADLNSKILINYLEIYSNAEEAAWDKRNIYVQVKYHVRRDFAGMFDSKGGTIQIGQPDFYFEGLNRMLLKISTAINELESLLEIYADSQEELFHKFFEENPFFVDLYGEVESKPRLTYPKGEFSPTGKQFLVPDFIVTYPDQSYRLIEIERPNKEFATIAGHPRQEFNQAAFQIAEWKHFLKNHYTHVKDKYPGILSNCSVTLIISRAHQKTFDSTAKAREYIQMLKEDRRIDEIFTYDDLLDKAKAFYYKLSTIN